MADSPYIRDIAYASNYNRGLNPMNLWYVMASNGAVQASLPACFRYCDLGCGDGTTLNILAANYPDAHFIGIDFNAEHIQKARTAAARFKLANVEYFQADFNDLGGFDARELDFIVCFGAFSWISRHNQDRIFQFAGQTLCEGGALLLHYAAKPGKVQIDPLWHLLRTYGLSQAPDDSLRAVEAGSKIINRLLDDQGVFFQQNPLAADRARHIKTQDPSYLAHEALTNWNAYYHTEISQRAQAVNLQFIASADLSDSQMQMRVPPAYRELVGQEADISVRETLIDYLQNRGIRKDLYVKSPGKTADRWDLLKSVPFALNGAQPEMIPTHTQTPAGQKFSFESSLYKGIITTLWEKSRSPEQLAQLPVLAHFSHTELLEALGMLTAAEIAVPMANGDVKHSKPADANPKPSTALSKALLEAPIHLNQPFLLPSPRTGQCIPLGPLIALILRGLPNSENDASLAQSIIEIVRPVAPQLFPAINASELDTRLDALIDNKIERTRKHILPRLVRLGAFRVE